MKKSTAAEVIPTVPGTLFAGGLYCYRLFDGIEPYALVVSTRAGDLGEVAHAQAIEKVSELKIGGQDDWTLPTRAEALAMFEHLRDPIAETDDALKKDWYWTSQQSASYTACAWCQSFGLGGQSYDHKSVELRARAVRRIKI